MVGGVEWADLEVGACVVLPALHQVELNRVYKVKVSLRMIENAAPFQREISVPECAPQ